MHLESGSLFSMVRHLHHVGFSHSTLRFPFQRLFLMNLPALLIAPKSFAMDLIISSSQSLSTLHDVPIEKEVCIGLDIDAVTEATDSEMTEADGSSQTSSWNGAEDEHEHGSTSLCQQQLIDEDVAPLSPEETLLVRKSSILLRSSSAEDVKFIKTTKRCWRSLPRPDLDEMVRSTSSPDLQTETGAFPSRSSSVRFSDVSIRSYSQTLGDNPSCSYGPPVQLDWDYEENLALAIDEYEDNRPPRRSMRQMVLSYYVRKNMLMFYYGVSEEELKASKRRINREKLCRSVTASSVLLMPMEAVLESVARKAKRFWVKKSES